MKLKLKSQQATLEDIDATKGIMVGYLSNWENLDSDGDFTVKGKTFVRTVTKAGPSGTGEIRYLRNHDWDQVAGVFVSITEDAKGLRYESQLTKSRSGVFTPRSEELIALYDSGFKYNHSYGYQVVDQEKANKGNALLDVEMHEGSILTMPGANRLTPVVGMKWDFSSEDIIEEAIQQRTKCDLILNRGNLQDDTYKHIQDYRDACDLIIKAATKQIIQSSSESNLNTNTDALISAFSKGLFTTNN